MITSQNFFTRIEQIRASVPKEGLFAEKDWLISPEPFVISGRLAEQLKKLGHRLSLFQRACNELYQRSVAGKQPGWIAEYLDAGKPEALIAESRRKAIRGDLPAIIRPDLILTEEGFAIAELDSVPGGIGLTQWMNATYGAFGTHDLLGGENGMLDGFLRILGGSGTVLISKEASTYRPEMEYLGRISGGAIRVRDAETFTEDLLEDGWRSLYRFFELFDLPNILAAGEIFKAVESGVATITPPFKPYLEEKLWFALFWMRPLREYWRRELSEQHFLELEKVIPYTWILDPQPIPQHAVIPGLEIHSWEELKTFSQKQRELILKMSGFDERAWGSRSVVLGSDSSVVEWGRSLTSALKESATHPSILQRFHKGRLVEQSYLDRETGEVAVMSGRVRLCPYYFVDGGKTEIGGALATICPADKKLIHGMRDAIMVPTAVQVEE